MIYKYTKCESVIAKIMADANMTDKDMRVTDMREWIFEAVEKIGAPVQYIQKESGADGEPVLKIQDYQVPIPCDMETLTAVSYSRSPKGPWFPVRSNEATFKEPTRTDFSNGPKYHHMPEQMHAEKIPTHRSVLLGINHSSAVEEAIHQHRDTEPTYFIKPGWVVLNKNKGYVKLAYRSIATDERGYPLIPDLASYQEAIYWYVMMKLNFPKFLNGSLGGRSKYNFQTYQYLQQQWHHYRNLAYGEAMMPNEGEMISIKNEWNKLIPDWAAEDTLFITNGQKQLNYNDYYYGY